MAAATLGVIALVVTALPWSAFWTSHSKSDQGTASEQQSVTPATVISEPAKADPVPPPAPEQIVAPKATLAAKPAESIEPLQKTSALQPTPVPAQPQEPQPAPKPSNVSEPVLVSQVQPAYTPEAKEARIQGTVEVVATVNEDGSVKVERINKSLGYGLDEAATAAVEQWRFRPGTKDGKPVAVTTSILINFSLR
jgi:TonB family protein